MKCEIRSAEMSQRVNPLKCHCGVGMLDFLNKEKLVCILFSDGARPHMPWDSSSLVYLAVVGRMHCARQLKD